MVKRGRVGELGKCSGKEGMWSVLWVVLLSLNVVVATRELVEMKEKMEDYMFPLQHCDFHFKGHRSIPPILNLQNPNLSALSYNIISRDGKALVSGATGDHCRFPAYYGEETGESLEEVAAAMEEIAAVCAEHFHMELDRLTTTALGNVTEWFTKSLNGRQVVLPLTAMDLEDGTQLRTGDGDRRFPEPRRCVTFFTGSDVTTLLDKVLNKAHRKKLSKISVRAQRFRYDFNLLLNSILQFP